MQKEAMYLRWFSANSKDPAMQSLSQKSNRFLTAPFAQGSLRRSRAIAAVYRTDLFQQFLQEFYGGFVVELSVETDIWAFAAHPLAAHVFQFDTFKFT